MRSLHLVKHRYLSDFDHMKQQRLPNWGRCARASRPHANAFAIASIYSRGARDNRPGIDSEGQYSGSHEESTKLDHEDADYLDRLIIKLDQTYRRTLISVYYQQARTPVHDLDTAIRMLLDLTSLNNVTFLPELRVTP